MSHQDTSLLNIPAARSDENLRPSTSSTSSASTGIVTNSSLLRTPFTPPTLAKSPSRVSYADLMRSGENSTARLGNVMTAEPGADTSNDALDVEERLAQQRRERRRKVSVSVTKAKERTTKHINQFIRIHVQFRDKKGFPITVDRTKPIEYIARQIEAEYAIRYIIDINPKKPDLQQYGETDLLGSIAYCTTGDELGLIQITQLYDAGNLGMPFSAKVGDLLTFDDVITAVTTEEVTPDDSIEEADELIKELNKDGLNLSNSKFSNDGHNMGSAFELHNLRYSQTAQRKAQVSPGQSVSSPTTTRPLSKSTSVSTNKAAAFASAGGVGSTTTTSQPRDTSPSPQPSQLTRNGTIKFSNLDERLQSVLHNIISMQFFNEFCLQEFTAENALFWIEVEIYRSISDTLIRRVFAQYVYLTYVAPDRAPLAVNISTDVLRDIQWPIPDDPPLTFFDEVQEHVYAMIKGHSYARFEKSKIFERFLEFKLSDRYTYIQGRVLWTFDQMFTSPEHLDQIAEAVQILEDPTSTEGRRALVEFGDGQFPSIASLMFRQNMLAYIIGRYFPLVSPVIRGYFNQTNRSKWAGRQKRIHKQKKLTRFFGERPTTEQLRQQTVEDTADGNAAEGAPTTTSDSELFDVNQTDTDTNPDKTIVLSIDHSMRKKAEKLVGFFGESRLPKKQLRRQINASHDNGHAAIGGENGHDGVFDDGGDDNDNVDESGCGIDSGDTRSVEAPFNVLPIPMYATGETDADDAIPIGTQNELSAEERRALNRRARKLRTVLGETLDERTVTDKITRPVVALKTASGENLLADDARDVLKPESTRPSTPTRDSIYASGLKSESVTCGVSGIASDGASLSPMTRLTRSKSDVEKSGGIDPSRLVLKARLDKLSQFLGHRINETDIIDAKVNPTQSTSSAARPLTLMEKKKYQKQSTKLERMLGSTVPAQALLNYNASNDASGSAVSGSTSGGNVGNNTQANAINTTHSGAPHKSGTALPEVDLTHLLTIDLSNDASNAMRMLSQILDTKANRLSFSETSTSITVNATGTDPKPLDVSDTTPSAVSSNASTANPLTTTKRININHTKNKSTEKDPFDDDNNEKDDDDDNMDPDEFNKRNKQQRLNKLRKILGSDIKTGVVIEKQLIDLIERSIEQNVDDPEEREVMTEGLKRLKTIAEKNVVVHVPPPVVMTSDTSVVSVATPAYVVKSSRSPTGSVSGHLHLNGVDDTSSSENDKVQKQQQQQSKHPRQNSATESPKNSPKLSARLSSLATTGLRKSNSFVFSMGRH